MAGRPTDGKSMLQHAIDYLPHLLKYLPTNHRSVLLTHYGKNRGLLLIEDLMMHNLNQDGLPLPTLTVCGFFVLLHAPFVMES